MKLCQSIGARQRQAAVSHSCRTHAGGRAGGPRSGTPPGSRGQGGESWPAGRTPRLLPPSTHPASARLDREAKRHFARRHATPGASRRHSSPTALSAGSGATEVPTATQTARLAATTACPCPKYLGGACHGRAASAEFAAELRPKPRPRSACPPATTGPCALSRTAMRGPPWQAWRHALPYEQAWRQAWRHVMSNT
jgi:hypothetical protein